MTYKIMLSAEDYLNYQLFNASKSPLVKRSRLRNWVIIVLSFVLLAISSKTSGNDPMFYLFLFVSLVSLIFYPYYSKWIYKNHYKRHIKHNHQGMIGVKSILELSDDVIIGKDESGESRLKTTQIERIDEIENYIFLKLQSGQTLIIPMYKIDKQRKLREQLERWSENLKIPYEVELEWKWK